MYQKTVPTPNKKQQEAPKRPPAPIIHVWALAGELGLLIVIPLLILLLIGIRIDRWAGTTPLFIIAGLVLSFLVSSVAIFKKVQRIQDKELP